MGKNKKFLGDLSDMSYFKQKELMVKYVDSLLDGELHDILKEKGNPVFKGISRQFTKKYIQDFREMLILNDNTEDYFENCIDTTYKDAPANMFVAFLVFQNNQKTAFGSFREAYIRSNELYLYNNMIFDKEYADVLSKNTSVMFGKVIVQNGVVVFEDTEEVINKDFYSTLINS